MLDRKFVKALQDTGGRVYTVGGTVRDSLMNCEPKDIDVEVHEISEKDLVKVLSKFGKVDLVGKSYGVYRIQGVDIDFSLPRKESKFGPGHKDYDVTIDPYMGVAVASKRRDFTINAIYQDQGTGKFYDDYNGHQDIEDKILRVVDNDTFIEDPLRVLRGAQFISRFCLTPTKETTRLCKRIKDEYETLPKDRVFGELRKLLMGQYPSLGIQFLKDCGWLSHWPELDRLWGVPQDPQHHPEGTVDRHILEVVDRAVGIRSMLRPSNQLVYMLAALLHDVGKYTHTYYRTEPKRLTNWKKKRPNDSRIVSYGHDSAGEEVARTFLQRVTEEGEILKRVPGLVKFHMKPLLMKDARDKAFRKISKQGCEMEIIGYLSWADKGQRPSYWFDKIDRLVLNGPKETVVQGRDLLDRGYEPGPKMGEIIRQAEDLYVKTGITDVGRLLDIVLGKKK